ncbi:Fur family transcriptional regulator [Oleidesulfovibrio sp.]|uniref:Fur family transcriptional regulator n=1 Tax=Oleidesulfovibrio sp. TaxID=2909707 RepID=UPI003A8AE155
MQHYTRMFQDFIAEKRMKWTQQREAVVHALWTTEEHVTCEELAARLATQGRRIGLATVYRNLRLLVDAGLAREFHSGGASTRYERYVEDDHHDHLICERCGTTVEFLDETLEQLQEQLAVKHDFRLTGHKMYLYGLCPDCRPKSSR